METIKKENNDPISKMINTLNISSVIATRVYEVGDWEALFKKKFCAISSFGDVTTYDKPQDLLSGMAKMEQEMGYHYIAFIIVNGYSYLLSDFKNSNGTSLFNAKLNPDIKKDIGSVNNTTVSNIDNISDDVDEKNDEYNDFRSWGENREKHEFMEWIVDEYDIDENVAELIINNNQQDNLHDYMYITEDGIVENAIDEIDLKEKIIECMHCPGIFDVSYIFSEEIQVDVSVKIDFKKSTKKMPNNLPAYSKVIPYIYVLTNGKIISAYDKNSIKESILNSIRSDGLFDIDFMLINNELVDIEIEIEFNASGVTQEDIEISRSGGSVEDIDIDMPDPGYYNPMLDLGSWPNNTHY